MGIKLLFYSKTFGQRSASVFNTSHHKGRRMLLQKKTLFLVIWVTSWENLYYSIGEQQIRRSACASAQTDQRRCSHPRLYTIIDVIYTQFLVSVHVAEQAGLSLIWLRPPKIFSWPGSSLRQIQVCLLDQTFSVLGSSQYYYGAVERSTLTLTLVGQVKTSSTYCQTESCSSRIGGRERIQTGDVTDTSHTVHWDFCTSFVFIRFQMSWRNSFELMTYMFVVNFRAGL